MNLNFRSNDKLALEMGSGGCSPYSGFVHPQLTRSSSNADMSLSSNDEILAAKSSSFNKRFSLFARARTFFVVVDDGEEMAAGDPRTYA